MLRRQIPAWLIARFLDRGVLLQPGSDTRTPDVSVGHYRHAIEGAGQRLANSTIGVIGYGGAFGVALHMLEQGVKKVILQDPFAPPRTWRNRRLDPARMTKYFDLRGDHWVPKAEFITIVTEPLESYVRRAPASCDYVVSNSVLEHVSSLETLIPACHALTREGGLNVHLVDLRDHYFRYPFEMLCYSDATWERWLNASNNLNRRRYGDYEKMFGQGEFRDVQIEIRQSLPDEFRRLKGRVLPRFVSGNELHDSASIIRITARC